MRRQLRSGVAVVAVVSLIASARPLWAQQALGAAPVVRRAPSWQESQPVPVEPLPTPGMPEGYQLPPVTPLEPSQFQQPEQPAGVPDYAGRLFGRSVELQGTGGQRDWTASLFTWQATALAHRPLYFEELNLERHGLSLGIWQPAVSAGHAFGRVVALPYMMTKHPPHRVQYTLGHVRPGNPVPYRVHRLPDDPKALAVEAGVIAGGILLIP